MFRQSLNASVDGVTLYNAVQNFTKLFLLPACLLAAPKPKQTEAVGAEHHTLPDTICGVSDATHNFGLKKSVTDTSINAQHQRRVSEGV